MTQEVLEPSVQLWVFSVPHTLCLTILYLFSLFEWIATKEKNVTLSMHACREREKERERERESEREREKEGRADLPSRHTIPRGLKGLNKILD